MGTALLSSTISGLSFISSQIVHPTYFPYPWAPVLHSARISLVFQTLGRRNSASWKKLFWGPYIVGYLLACWGGGVLTHLTMGLPPPQFYSFHPWINYITVHLVLTALFNVFPGLLVPKIYDTLLFPLDGLLRAHSVVSAVSLPANPAISNPLSALSSPNPHKAMDTALGHIILGVIASSAGGITLSTLSLWSDDWRFSTPPILKATFWGSADVWGGAIAAIIYSSSTHAAAFAIPPFASLTPAYFPLTLLPQRVFDFFFVPGTSSSFTAGFDAGAVEPVSRFVVPCIHWFAGLVSAKTFVVEDPMGATELKLDAPPVYQTAAVPIGPVEAKGLVAIALISIFAARVLMTHWIGPAAAPPPKASSAPAKARRNGEGDGKKQK